jgi:hypothetical protein
MRPSRVAYRSHGSRAGLKPGLLVNPGHLLTIPSPVVYLGMTHEDSLRQVQAGVLGALEARQNPHHQPLIGF